MENPLKNWHRPAASILLAMILSLAAARAGEPDSSRLIGHWPLQNDGRDRSGGGLNGQPYHVKFHDAAAQFNGRDSRVEIADQPALQLGASDFTVALWVHTAAEL